jgi:hypothetical protein
MFDIFYSGPKPNLFAHEQAARDIDHARELSSTRYFWWVNYLTDYTGFDFLFEPVPWEANHRHVWPSQWQTDSGTYLIPKQGYTETNYKTNPVLTRLPVVPRVEINHMDGNVGQVAGVVATVRYFDNYRDILIRIANNSEHEYVWIVSSCCDYTDFDFSWHPEVWQNTMLHVFASDGEKFGDTFYMHVPSFRERIAQFELLDWYDVNFIPVGVPRRPVPVIQHSYDTHVEAVKTRDWSGPLALFSTDDTIGAIPTVPLWGEKTKTIVPLSPGASQVIVPKTAVPYIKTQLYDYPYIDKTQKHWHKDQLMDIVFISYDEPVADANWKILQDRFPRARRVHGIAGMELALEAAADTAKTAWYFAVFAKTRLYENFNFDFVPDRMQAPKHYIFDARNTVNGLEYGHMGIILYNSAGIRGINQTGKFGLDYTLSFPHESVPMLSCYGEFDQTPYHTWRTAFRESAKLAYFENLQCTVEGAHRLNIWQTRADGPYAEWCLKGARDGVEFFNSSDKELTTLKQSFRWEWLRNYFVNRYGRLD